MVTADPAVLEAYDTPEAPTMLSTDTIYCKREPRLDLQATPINEGTIYWYKNMSYRSAVGSGNKHALTKYAPDDYLFTAMELLSNGCYSKPADVKVKILDDLKLGLHDTAACLGAVITLRPAEVPEGSTFLWTPGDYMTESIDVTVKKTPAVYTLTVTDPSYGKYCQTTDSVTVRNGNTPIRKDTTVCVGGTVLFDVPEALLLAWTDGAAAGAREIQAVAGQKLYYAEGLFENGCTYEYIFALTGQKATPVVVDTTVCIGGTLQLDVPEASLLTWKDDTVKGARDILGVAGKKTYNAEAVLDGGCIVEYTFNVTGQQAEPARMDTLVCEFEPLHLDVPDAVLLTWRDDTVKGARDIQYRLFT